MIRRSPIETKINHERWLISYSDFITLLFAFFVVMYSVSQVNESKYRVLSSTLEAAFSKQDDLAGDVQRSADESQKVVELESISRELSNALSGLIEQNQIKIFGNQQWVELEFNASLLFESGSAEINLGASALLNTVAELLIPYENAIAVAGHTDNIPTRGGRYDDNWLLSSARAVAVVNFLAYQGVRPERLSAVGYGEYRPIKNNDTEEGRLRNRRVVIQVAQQAAPITTMSLIELDPEGDDGADEEPASIVSAESAGERSQAESGLNTVPPVRLKGGGLLFTSDPDLPRSNPPLEDNPAQNQNQQ